MIRSLPSRACLLAATILLSPFARGQASEIGAWAAGFSLPLPAIHSVLMPPDGNLLLYSYEIFGGPGTLCWVLDPVSVTVTPYPLANVNVFCGGQSLLPNGDALVVGGTGSQFNTGNSSTYYFNEASGWTQTATMNVERWYPTVTRLGDGRFLVMAGLDAGGLETALVETFDPQTQAWTVLAGADKLLPLYPMNFQVASGAVITAGPQRRTESLDPNTGIWTYVDDTAKDHNEGTAVLLPPYPDRIMVTGGHNNHSTFTRKKCEILDLSAPVPQWRTTTPMNRRRQHHNTILLPDGKVLAVGGRRIALEVDKFATQKPFFRAIAQREAELFDPINETWTIMAAQTRPRLYHSTAVLLRDGRVFTCGGEQEPSGEIYSPPYLFKGPRPTLTGVPASVGYGSTFQVSSDQASQIVSACLIAPGATTHSFDQNQRFIAVTAVDVGGGVLDITAPALNTVAPPGIYMLFLVNATGVPSVAEFIQVL
jgi:galactose oxidase